MSLSRRAFVCSAAATAGAMTLPAMTAVAPLGARGEPLRYWIAGTPGESNWECFLTKTASEAENAWRNENLHECNCPEIREETGDPEEFCESCSVEVGSQPFDPQDPEKGVVGADWLRNGCGFCCARCGDETDHNDGYPVGDDAVCSYCMTLADWDIVNPERAAELRAEFAARSRIPSSAGGMK